MIIYRNRRPTLKMPPADPCPNVVSAIEPRLCQPSIQLNLPNQTRQQLLLCDEPAPQDHDAYRRDAASVMASSGHPQDAGLPAVPPLSEDLSISVRSRPGPDYEHGTGGVVEYLRGHGSEQQPGESSVPSGTNDQQVGVHRSIYKDGDCGPLDDVSVTSTPSVSAPFNVSVCIPRAVGSRMLLSQIIASIPAASGRILPSGYCPYQSVAETGLGDGPFDSEP